jgi:hypothetical protein
MTISVELMAKVIINKHKIKVKGKKEPYVCPRTLYTSALFGMMEGNDEGIDWVSICKCMLYLHPHTNDSFSYGHCWLSNEEATCCPLQDGPRSSP